LKASLNWVSASAVSGRTSAPSRLAAANLLRGPQGDGPAWDPLPPPSPHRRDATALARPPSQGG
jgi:hypothetical protein